MFKVEDRVYDGTIQQWGTIVQINNRTAYYPIHIDFGNHLKGTYTLDGRKYMDNMPVLSFTEYDFVNGGFSQVRPQPKIEKDQLVYVKMKVDNEWKLRYFSHFDENGKLCFFSDQEKSAEATFTVEAIEYSLENPLTSNRL